MFGRRTLTAIWTALTVVILLPGGAAQARMPGWGPRVGFTLDPDQVLVGAHLDLGYISREIRLQPNFEIGVGGDHATAAFNFEGIHDFAAYRSGWAPYVGTGLGVVMTSAEPGRGDLSHSDLGFQILGGMERSMRDGNRMFTEIKLGLAESPAFKWTVGWTFFH